MSRKLMMVAGLVAAMAASMTMAQAGGGYGPGAGAGCGAAGANAGQCPAAAAGGTCGQGAGAQGGCGMGAGGMGAGGMGHGAGGGHGYGAGHGGGQGMNLLTQDERAKFHADMHAVTTVDQCNALVADHQKLVQERAQAQGVTPPAGPRGNPCERMKARGRIS